MPRLLLASLLLVLLAPPAAGARTITVDCSRGDRLIDVRPAAGDDVRLRRGTSCTGRLVVEAPGVRVGAYGEGPPPRIDADGPEAVLVRDADDVVVEDLELTNRGDGTAAKRRGVHLVSAGTVVRGVVVRRLHVHHVAGNLDKDGDGSGGIQVTTSGPHHFDGLRIEDNRIEEVSRSAIFIVGTTDPARPRATEPWPRASTGVVVRGNTIDGIAGDGIVPLGTDRALVEDNVVRHGNRAGRSPFDPAGMICNAGIWPFHANGTVVRRNLVEGFDFNGCDGTAFDIDYDTDGTVIEQNVSRDNEGGFLLLCLDDAPRTAVVRSNLSVGDGATLHESPCRLSAQGFSGTLDGIRVHNNTFMGPVARVLTPASGDVALPVLANAGSFEFTNNIVVSTAGQATPLPCGTRCTNNLFHRLPPSGTAFVLGDPRLDEEGRLGAGSPARLAGLDVGPFTDRFGAPASSPPSIGAHQPAAPLRARLSVTGG